MSGEKQQFQEINSLLNKWSEKLKSASTTEKTLPYCLSFNPWSWARGDPNFVLQGGFNRVDFGEYKLGRWDFKTYATHDRHARPLLYYAKTPNVLYPPEGLKGFELLIHHGVNFEIKKTDETEATQKMFQTIKDKLEELKSKKDDSTIILSTMTNDIIMGVEPRINRKFQPTEIDLTYDKELKEQMEAEEKRVLEEAYNVKGRLMKEKSFIEKMTMILSILEDN